MGLEPPMLQHRHSPRLEDFTMPWPSASVIKWYREEESNLRRSRLQRDALPTELPRHDKLEIYRLPYNSRLYRLPYNSKTVCFFQNLVGAIYAPVPNEFTIIFVARIATQAKMLKLQPLRTVLFADDDLTFTVAAPLT